MIKKILKKNFILFAQKHVSSSNKHIFSIRICHSINYSFCAKISVTTFLPICKNVV